MTKEQYQELKAELKELATAIRENKTDKKTKQRAFSKVGDIKNKYFNGDVTSNAWEKARPEYNSTYNAQLNALWKVEKLQAEYRWKHIIYSLARGKSLKQIEPKTASNDYQKELNTTNAYKKVNEMAKKYDIEDFYELFSCAGDAA